MLKAIHPSVILKEEFLEVYTDEDVAELNGVITFIVEGGDIDERAAFYLGREFRNSPAFWLGLQRKYDEDVLEDKRLRALVKPWYSSLQSLYRLLSSLTRRHIYK